MSEFWGRFFIWLADAFERAYFWAFRMGLRYGDFRVLFRHDAEKRNKRRGVYVEPDPARFLRLAEEDKSGVLREALIKGYVSQKRSLEEQERLISSFKDKYAVTESEPDWSEDADDLY